MSVCGRNMICVSDWACVGVITFSEDSALV